MSFTYSVIFVDSQANIFKVHYTSNEGEFFDTRGRDIKVAVDAFSHFEKLVFDRNSIRFWYTKRGEYVWPTNIISRLKYNFIYFKVIIYTQRQYWILIEFVFYRYEEWNTNLRLKWDWATEQTQKCVEILLFYNLIFTIWFVMYRPFSNNLIIVSRYTMLLKLSLYEGIIIQTCWMLETLIYFLRIFIYPLGAVLSIWK